MSATMRPRLSIAVACALAMGAGMASSSSASSDPAPAAPTTGRLLVRVATPEVPPPGTGKPRREPLANARELIDRVEGRTGAETVLSIPETGTIVVEPGAGDAGELTEQLEADPRVVDVRPEQAMTLRFTPNDYAFSHLDPNAPGSDFGVWPLRRYHAQRAWNLSKGAGARVAVLDTGVYVAHPDLSGNLVGQLDCSTVVNASDSCVPGGSVADSVGHGTHVAGLACGDTNDGYGIASLGFRCGLDAIRLDPSYGYGSIAAAIVSAANRHADAISMSFGGGGPDPSLFEALAYARNAGSVLVAAAANDPSPGASTNQPAQWIQSQGSGPNIYAGRGLVVTMAKHDGTRNSIAQKNSGVSVAAFGSATDELSGGEQGILSTWPQAPVSDDILLIRTVLNGDPNYAYLVGTSMATPQVSGLVALIRAARPQMSPEKVERLVKLTADGFGEYGRGLGWGIIDAHAAMGAALGRDITPPRSHVRSARIGHPRRAAAAARPVITLRLKRFDRSRPAMPTSGIRHVNVLISVNGRRFKLLRKTRKKRIRFRGRRGREYEFFSRALDRAGNREDPPASPDASLALG